MLSGLLGALSLFLNRLERHLGLSWGPLGRLLGHLGVLLGASRAVLERSWEPLGPSWTLFNQKTECASKGIGTFFISGALLVLLSEPS